MPREAACRWPRVASRLSQNGSANPDSYTNSARARMKTTRNELHQVREQMRRLLERNPTISPLELLARLPVGCALRQAVRQMLHELPSAKRRRKRLRQRRRRRIV